MAPNDVARRSYTRQAALNRRLGSLRRRYRDRRGLWTRRFYHPDRFSAWLDLRGYSLAVARPAHYTRCGWRPRRRRCHRQYSAGRRLVRDRTDVAGSEREQIPACCHSDRGIATFLGRLFFGQNPAFFVPVLTPLPDSLASGAFTLLLYVLLSALIGVAATGFVRGFVFWKMLSISYPGPIAGTCSACCWLAF
jgi:hypothetical protein